MATAACPLPHRSLLLLHLALLAFLLAAAPAAQAWTGEIRGRVVCDVCADSAIGPEDHVLEGTKRNNTAPQLNLHQGAQASLSFDWPLSCLANPHQVHRVGEMKLCSTPEYLRAALLLKTCPVDKKRASRVDNLKSSLDHFMLEGAEVAVLCITKSGEVINYQAFTNYKGVYSVAETMPESDRWDSCLARPISSFHQHCTRRGDAHSGVKFTYNKQSGSSHNVKTFLYKPANVPLYCS
ncbi:hypothetical protein TRIUR3_26793 [Triticum urartu]|uniref:Uncharacterized protein n=1 Tax=Triticum urartu TaxID=4572 RepID=M7ZIG4_TRIUA|nr:hypothetical protein TRIUR3_26793 [Triticum urartu]